MVPTILEKGPTVQKVVPTIQKKKPPIEEDPVDDDRKESKKNKKRLVGTCSRSIKQMKDAVVRAQAVIAATKVSTIQSMTSYESKTQAQNCPKSETLLLNYDEIVERPDKQCEGERARKVPKWAILVPIGADEKEIGLQLEKLGRAIQVGKKRGKKGGKAAKNEPLMEFDYSVVRSNDNYLESIYGPVPKAPKKAKKMDEYEDA